MRRILISVALFCSFAAPAQETRDASRVREDANVIRRVLQVSKKEIPRDIIESIAREDLELLRGRRADGSYAWARFEREEGGRQSAGFTVAAGEKATSLRHRGETAYRLVIEAPTRRYVVRRNQRVFIERVTVDLTPYGSERARLETYDLGEWLTPGQKRDMELPAIARTARAIVTARTEENAGPATVELTWIQAKLVDDPRSPWADAVENLKLMLSRLEKGDRANLTTLANLIAADPALGGGSADTVVSTSRVQPRPDAGLSSSELYVELQRIEDLLTGDEAERREGLDLLHQLVRKMRNVR